MRVVSVVRLAAILAALAAATRYAILPGRVYSAAPVQASANRVGEHHAGIGDRARAAEPDARHEDARALGMNRSARGVTLPLPKAPKEFPKSRQSSLSKGEMNVRAAQPTRSEFAANGGFVRSRRSDMLRPVRTVFAKSFAPPLNSVPHRGRNPAVVGSTERANSSYIDGNQIKRKP